MKIHRGKLEDGGPLAGHYRVGKTYSPPLMAMDATVLVDWFRDDLPDLLWPAALIGLKGESGLGRFIGWQQRAISVLEHQAVDPAAESVDGRLTSLETVEEVVREGVVAALTHEMAEAGVLPDPLLAALRLYDDLPGRWLLVDPCADADSEITDDEALSFLGQAVVACVSDGHKEAMLKFVGINWAVLTKRFSSDVRTIDLLKVYPRDPETVKIADTVIRAAFGASKGAEYHQASEVQARHADWARRFWKSNWRMSSCLLREDVELEPTNQTETGGKETATAEVLHAVQTMTEEFNRFLDGFFECQEHDLYDPAKHEVIAGLVTRAVRSVTASLRAPHLWCGEYGSSLTRLLAETEIVLAWLAMSGPDSYAQFQAFGLGKAKLMRTHMTDLANEFPDGPPEMLSDALQHIEKKLGGEWGEAFIPVSIDSTFAGRSVRGMAQDTGLEDLYRHVYQSASGVSHGEWWAVEDYAMQRCFNPLHRFHQVPSMEPVGGGEPALARYWVLKTAGLISMALDQLESDNSTGAASNAKPYG